ncbi:MAG: NAD(P)-binding domain-containing protein, partial [Clostridia bacterium]|nr:NAD(P)-binding domain-containing protein [Clostridia bacterium]
MLGFIGTGNMATAIIKGVISSGLLKGEEIGVFDLQKEKSEALSKEFGLKAFTSSVSLAESCNKIVLSVKPNVISSV